MNVLQAFNKSFISISVAEKCFNRKSVSGVITSFVLILFIHSVAIAQKLDVAYVPTPDFVVERMLDMANVGPGDYVIDPGCGDGRIVIAAAKRGAFGHGVDLDPQRIEEARENAEKAGVADKVVFKVENIFDTDFSRANVIAMYLFPDINLKLRPAFLDKLEPGSRIVSHDFGMDEWKPDHQHGRMEDHAVYS
jgi:tRNA G37 N-methylase Trm5